MVVLHAGCRSVEAGDDAFNWGRIRSSRQRIFASLLSSAHGAVQDFLPERICKSGEAKLLRKPTTKIITEKDVKKSKIKE